MVALKIEPPWFCRAAWKLNPGWLVGCCGFGWSKKESYIHKII